MDYHSMQQSPATTDFLEEPRDVPNDACIPSDFSMFRLVLYTLLIVVIAAAGAVVMSLLVGCV
jgi:hypothetical protein